MTEWQDFKVVKKLIKHFKSLYGSGGRCLNITDICKDFEPCFKFYNFVSVYPKRIKLGQMLTVNVIFHVLVSAYRLVKIWNSPQFPGQFRNGQYSISITHDWACVVAQLVLRVSAFRPQGSYSGSQALPIFEYFCNNFFSS